MKHLSVGEPASFDISRLRGAVELAREDAERNEWLAKRAREITREEMDPPRFCVCGQQIHFNSARRECKRCANRRFMRNQRRRERG